MVCRKEISDNIPSCIVPADTDLNAVGVGNEAKEVVGRTPGSIVAQRPLKDGVIANFDITSSMLQIFIKKVFNNSVLARPRAVICIPSGVTAVERRAVKAAALKAGARQVFIIEEPMAAAVGVTVEGELGHVGFAKDGVSTEYTKVDEAVRFVEETGVTAYGSV